MNALIYNIRDFFMTDKTQGPLITQFRTNDFMNPKKNPQSKGIVSFLLAIRVCNQTCV